MKKKKVIIIILVVVVVIIIGVNVLKEAASSVDFFNDSYYQLYTVKNQEFGETATMSGKVSSDAVVNVTSNLTGVKVNTLNIEIGDTVQKGDIIATLDVNDLQRELNELVNEEKSEKTTHQKVLDRAISNRDRSLEQLQKTIDTIKKELDGLKEECNKLNDEVDDESEKTTINTNCENISILEKELATARSEYTREENSLNESIEDAETAVNTSSYSSRIKELRNKINSSKVYAPASGLVTGINVNVGTILSTDNLATIQTGDSYKVVVTVPETQILKIKKGMKANVTTVATGNQVFSGTISKIINIPSSNTDEMGYSEDKVGYSAVITIDDKNTDLLVGMTAKCKVAITEKTKLLAVPYDAIKNDGTSNYVYKLVAEGGSYKVEYTEVEVGNEGKYYTEIKSGLSLSERILITDEIFSNGDVLNQEIINSLTDYVGD